MRIDTARKDFLRGTAYDHAACGGPYRGERLVSRKIFEHALSKPGKPAIFYGTRSITYRELASWIAQARHFLGEQDLRPANVAVLAVDCLVDSWVLGLALRSLGITTVAVGSPATLNQLAMRNIGCVITTIRERPLGLTPTGTNFKLIQIPQYFYLGKAAEDVPEAPMSPAGGHVLLTSGTTGTRKKVLIDDERLAIEIKRRAEVYDISERSIVNVFNLGTWTGAGYKAPACAWNAGASVVIHQFPDRHESLRVDGITHAYFTPETLANLLKTAPSDIRKSEIMRLFVGGASLPRALAAAARTRLSPHLYTYIGSTEAGPWALTRIASEEDLDSHCIHPTAEAQVVDEQDRPLPAGQMGVVRLRTADSVTSYLDDDAASRAVFRHGYFYSGDLGTFRADGRLTLNGRANNVINVLGNKIAVEPIELALQERLAVDGVCVLSMRSEGTDEEFHVVIESRRPIDKAELSSSISAQLRGVPYARVHFFAALPRTDTGKIDRAALRRRLLSEPSASAV